MLFTNIDFENQYFENQNIKLKNIIVLANAQSEGDGVSKEWTCYSSYGSCWFWDCTDIDFCGAPCTTVSADSWYNGSKCFS